MPSLTSRSRLWLAGLGALALWAAAYSNSLQNSFHFDDDHVIERNVYIRDLHNIPKFFTDARTFSTFAPNANYRPMVSLTLAIDYAVAGGLKPVAFHVTQLALCLLVGVLFFFVARALLRQTGTAPWHDWAALFAAALFLLHTGNAEPANYISARSESICAAGLLGSFLVYLGAPRLRPYFLYLIPMVIGALGKTPAVIFGPLLFSYKLIFEANPTSDSLRTRDGWKRLGRAALTGLPALVASVVVFKAVEGMNPPGQSYGGLNKIQYLWTQTWVWLRYLRLFVVPTGLSADNDMTLFPTWQDPRVLAGVAVLLLTLVLAALAALRPAWRPVSLGILWFWAGIAPTSTVFPLAEATNDHRMYLGWLGLSLAVATFLFERASVLLGRVGNPQLWRRALMATGAAVLLANAVGTWMRNRVWRNEETLWADTVQKSPGNGRAWMNYGLTQMSKGRYPKAKDAFERAAKLTPTYSVLAVNRAILAAATGDPKTADKLFKQSLTLIPRSGEAPYFYARFLIDQGRGPEALPMLQTAEKLDFGDPRPRLLHLDLAAALGHTDEVREIASRLVAIDGDPEAKLYLSGRPPFAAKGTDAHSWFQTGLNYTNKKDHAYAAQAYRMALQLDPKYADAWLNLGWSLLELGFTNESIQPFQRTLQLRPNDPLARNNLPFALGRLSAQRPGRPGP
jgi:tetratricopeptide (TPR) repeat protein